MRILKVVLAAPAAALMSIQTILGIDPTPFRIFLIFTPPTPIAPADIIGELDFSGVTGTLGSLNLSGLLVHEVDALGVQTGVTHSMALFTLQAIPEPSAAALLSLGLIAIAVARRRS